uniref:Uncharacterized protein n=1 Tax=Arundo donax TaxID=35708 RepID=A0A0A9AWM0_ARUDO
MQTYCGFAAHFLISILKATFRLHVTTISGMQPIREILLMEVSTM